MKTDIAQSSTLKSKVGSLKPSLSVFQKPTDERVRRRKLQQQIYFREKFQLENDYELIYAIPKERMYTVMHFLCTCGTIAMFTFVIIHFYREMLDIESPNNEINQIPSWVLYSVAAMIGSTFGLGLNLNIMSIFLVIL